MLEICHLDIAFDTPHGRISTVRDMSLTLKPGEITGLVGESGSGKTLVSLAVLGLLPVGAHITRGQICFKEQNLLTLPREALRRLRGNRISMIFQDPHAALDPVFTCGAQIVDAIQSHESVSRKAALARARTLLEKLHLPDPARTLHAYPHELSGGQCQRVMIAMAMACQPDVIIADEPTTALDVTVQKQVLELLKDLNREVGAAVLLITHDLGVVSQVADQVVVMYRGDKVEQAPVRQLFSRPQSDYTRFLIDATPAIGKRTNAPETGLRHDEAVKDAIASATPPTPVLRAVNLTKQYVVRKHPLAPAATVNAVHDVSLDIPEGATLGLVGESGCGKSTLARLILQMLRPDTGQVWFDGEDLTALTPAQLRAARQKLALVFQNPYGSLNPRQTVADLIAAPLQIAGRTAEGPATARRLVDAVGLPTSSITKFPHQFSGGQRQRIAIARALALHPKLIILDEAVSALDVAIQAQILTLLKSLQAEFKLTYLLISHDLAVVENFCDTIAVMKSGQIIEAGSPATIFGSPKTAYTRELLAAVPHIDMQITQPPEAQP